MERHLKIFLMTFFGLVLPCLSFAYPDIYYFNNFLQGSSPFIGLRDNYSLNENGLWESYKPSLGQSDTILDGIVVSYSDDFMQGSNPKTAVPLVNFSKYGLNARVQLPSGGCCVLTCDGDISELYFTENLYCLLLGTTSPSDIVREQTIYPYASNMIYSNGNGDYISNNGLPLATLAYSSLSTINSSGQLNFIYQNYVFLNKHSGSISSQKSSFKPYSASYIWFLYNNTEHDIFISRPGNTTGPIINIDNVNFADVTWSLHLSSNIPSGDANYSQVFDGRFGYLFPDVAGDIDVYSLMWSNTSSGSYYAYSCMYSLHLSISNLQSHNSPYFSAKPNLTYSGGAYYAQKQFVVSNSEIESISGSNIPIFLKSAVRYISSTAIMINGGYINVNNYEELVAMLKENGVGSSDLSKIQQLLEEINSGGATGATVKELIDTLENYHQQLINNADFGSVTNVFDTYKNLLDFSDDMHWLITANNALFGYFTGFILMCAMFLILSRIMR